MMGAVPAPVVGVLLAGGRARRMGGGDKCLLELGGKTVLEHIVSNVSTQVDRIVLNANGDPSRFARFGLATTADAGDDHAGPLAGVLSGMAWACQNVPAARWIATFPADSPFLPTDLVAKLWTAVMGENADLGTVFCGDQAQPVCGLWPLHLADDLRDAVERRGVRKVDTWTARYRSARVVYDGDLIPDPFFNVNTPADLEEARRALRLLDERPCGP